MTGSRRGTDPPNRRVSDLLGCGLSVLAVDTCQEGVGVGPALVSLSPDQKVCLVYLNYFSRLLQVRAG